jgi:hypothetical protein
VGLPADPPLDKPPAPDAGDPPEPTLPAPPVVLEPLVTLVPLLAVDPVVTGDPPCPPLVVELLAVVPPSVRSLRSRVSSPPQPVATRPAKTQFASFIVCLARSKDFSRRPP